MSVIKIDRSSGYNEATNKNWGLKNVNYSVKEGVRWGGQGRSVSVSRTMTVRMVDYTTLGKQKLLIAVVRRLLNVS